MRDPDPRLSVLIRMDYMPLCQDFSDSFFRFNPYVTVVLQ